MINKIVIFFITFLIVACSKEMTTTQWCANYQRSALSIAKCLRIPQCTINKEDVDVLMNAKQNYPYCFRNGD